MTLRRVLAAVVAWLGILATATVADDPPLEELVKKLRELDANVLTPVDGVAPREMLAADLNARRRAANTRSTAEWRELRDRAAWEKYRAARLAALRSSLNVPPQPWPAPTIHVVRTLDGDGFQIDNLLYDNPTTGLWITANLYRPRAAATACPGIILSHSHHAPKTEGELQDMGMTWARLGCYVLVPDHLGHGERRQHPFAKAEDYSRSFRLGRQDYYFRFNTAAQLYLAGDSLMGVLVRDLMRGVDVLLQQPHIDPEKIALLGAVAGGGDPAACAGALDERISVVGPFNFGGPQPETRYPLPADAEESFNYLGGGSWESTRNLRNSARDGFLPWVIVGGVAPRRLIYGHEFRWDRDRDPVWKRLEQIDRWQDKPDGLAFAHGAGSLQGNSPEATHANNIGPPHRVAIHAALARWFGLRGGPDQEYSRRRSKEELACWTDRTRAELKPLTLAEQLLREQQFHDIAALIVPEVPQPAAKVATPRQAWTAALGDTAPRLTREAAAALRTARTTFPTFTRESLALPIERSIRAPLVLLRPSGQDSATPPVVVAFAQEGKARLLRERSNDVAQLLSRGVAVCLFDPRGVGETSPGDDRGRTSELTALAADSLMFGEPLLAARLRDVRTALLYLDTRTDLDRERIALWGDSFAAPNGAAEGQGTPYGVDAEPRVAAPLGDMLALAAAAHEKHVVAVWTRGGWNSFASAWEGPFLHAPFDAIIPGVMPGGDLPALAGELGADRARRTEMVDARNVRVKSPPAESPARWLCGRLTGK